MAYEEETAEETVARLRGALAHLKRLIDRPGGPGAFHWSVHELWAMHRYVTALLRRAEEDLSDFVSREERHTQQKSA
jgi:hypothetical protein